MRLRKALRAIGAAIRRWANATVAISILLHALAALVVGRVIWVVPAPPPSAKTPSVVWFGAWKPVPEAAEQQGQDNTDSEAGRADQGTVSLRETPQDAQIPKPVIAGEPSAPQPPAAPAEPPPAIDWAEARRRAIEDVAEERERAASYRSFSFPGTIDEEQALDESERQRRVVAGLRPPRTAFDSPSKGRAGLTEHNAFGEYIVWRSDECYQTFGTKNIFILPSAQGLFGAPMTICVSTHPREDIFANAKPSYLMGAEEHAERAERLIRLDTGAIASFGD
jgi:hypothetical protein